MLTYEYETMDMWNIYYEKKCWIIMNKYWVINNYTKNTFT